MCKRCTDEDARQAELDRRIDEGLAQQRWERLAQEWDERDQRFGLRAKSKVFD